MQLSTGSLLPARDPGACLESQQQGLTESFIWSTSSFLFPSPYLYSPQYLATMLRVQIVQSLDNSLNIKPAVCRCKTRLSAGGAEMPGTSKLAVGRRRRDLPTYDPVTDFASGSPLAPSLHHVEWFESAAPHRQIT